MLITAAYIYLPDHVLSLYRHINYYWAGQPVADQIALHAANMKLSTATATAAATTAEALKELWVILDLATYMSPWITSACLRYTF